MRFLCVALCLGCSDPSGTTLHGSATIDGATDHSGILVQLAGPTSATTITAGDGSYSFSVKGYAVVATASGTREGSLSATADGGEFPPLLFHAIGSLSGRVTRAGAQTGNQGILVSVEGSSSAALTDDSGGFEIDGLAPGVYDLGALAGGFLPGSATGLAVTRGGTTHASEIDLLPAPSGPPAASDLHGKAQLTGIDDASGIAVTLGALPSTITSADGSFVLANPPAGTFSLAFDLGAYHELIPQVLVLPGASGFILGDSLLPLDGSTVMLPRGRRLQSAIVYEFLLSPNGDYLVYRVSDGTLMTAPVAGGVPVVLDKNVPAGWSFSPDGQRVLYATRATGQTYDLHTRPVGGGPATDLIAAAAIFQNTVFTGSYRFIGDKVIVAEPAQGRLRVVPATGGAPMSLPNGAYNFVVSPAGDEVLSFGNCNGVCDLQRTPLSGAAPVTLMSAVQPGNLSASAGWDHAAFSDRTQVHIFNLASNQVVDFAGSSLVAFTPDGKRLIYLNNDLLSAPTDGGAATTLAASSTFNPYRIALSPAGTLVYFQGAAGVQRVPVGGGAVEALTGQTAFKFSPKGRWVELIGDGDPDQNTNRFSLGPAEGGPLTLISPSTVRPFEFFDADKHAFNSDESEVAYLTDDGHFGASGQVTVTAIDTVAPRQIGGGAIGINGLSPDGGSILYFTADSDTTLLVAPSDGSSAPLALLQHTWEPSGPNLRALFTGDGQVAALARNAPLGFQNGLYVLSVK